MKKSELIAKLEGAKELTSVVSIDLVLAALGMLEAEVKVEKVFGMSQELADEISSKIEQQNNIIQTLKEVDGETVQYILQKSGMDYQMLRQLIMSMPLECVQAEISERIELEKSLKKV